MNKLEDLNEWSASLWSRMTQSNKFEDLNGRFTSLGTGWHNSISLFGWLVADGWCWFVLRGKYCWLVAGGWFVLRQNYCWLVADKPSEQGVCLETGEGFYSFFIFQTLPTVFYNICHVRSQSSCCCCLRRTVTKALAILYLKLCNSVSQVVMG
jgi:hypothetical protein